MKGFFFFRRLKKIEKEGGVHKKDFEVNLLKE